jgi:RNA-directed DNA polymerase
MKWPRAKSLKKLKAAIRQKTRRSQGRSLKAICAELKGTLRGWFEYFKHSHYTALGPIEQAIRGRRRSSLRKRQGKKGRGRGLDHQRWPKAYFCALGLFSLKRAHAAACQSSGR